MFDKIELFNAFPRRDLLISIWALSNNPIVLNVKKLIIKVKEELYFKVDPERFNLMLKNKDQSKYSEIV